MQQTQQWDLYEITAHGPSDGNPFEEITFSATFTCSDISLRIPGFYDGNGIYKIRFMPAVLGFWAYKTASNATALTGISGTFECIPAAEGNHGPVNVSNTYHFVYADGTPHYSFGTTSYVWTHQGDALEETTLKTLAHAPFNKMRMCVFPKHYLFNNNEPLLYPFEGSTESGWDFARFNPAFFQHFEQRVNDLKHLGIEADIILFHPYDNGKWGFDHMGMENNQKYLRYLLARLSAFRNVWWSMANEYDFMTHLSIADWECIIKTVADNDPYHHLRSIHNGGPFFDHRNPLLTHASIQRQDMKGVSGWRNEFEKPIVMDECCYEGNIEYVWGNITEQEMTHRFWEGTLRGGYVGHGETYLHPDDVLWWSKGGELHGKSPARIAFLRQIIEQMPSDCHEPIVFEPAWENYACLGKEGAYYLVYFGGYRPAYKHMLLAKDVNYSVEIIDTWEMTITKIAGEMKAGDRIELPSKPYIALRIQKV